MIFYKHGKGASSSHVPIGIGMDSVSVMYELQDVLDPMCWLIPFAYSYFHFYLSTNTKAVLVSVQKTSCLSVRQ
jgi:hypothetical protein